MIGQGRENAKQYLKENPKLMEEIKKKVLAKLNDSGKQMIEVGVEDQEEEEYGEASLMCLWLPHDRISENVEDGHKPC